MAPVQKVLGLRDVVLMNVVAIVGLRDLSLAAANGNTAITLWIGALVLFFIPQAFAVIELTTRMPHEGGLYHWSKTTFGEVTGSLPGSVIGPTTHPPCNFNRLQPNYLLGILSGSTLPLMVLG